MFDKILSILNKYKLANPKAITFALLLLLIISLPLIINQVQKQQEIRQRAAPVVPSDTPSLEFYPQRATAEIGKEFTVDVRLLNTGSKDISGVAIIISYDPNLIKSIVAERLYTTLIVSEPDSGTGSFLYAWVNPTKESLKMDQEGYLTIGTLKITPIKEGSLVLGFLGGSNLIATANDPNYLAVDTSNTGQYNIIPSPTPFTPLTSRVFVTSDMYTGNLVQEAIDRGLKPVNGLEAGDMLCQQSAKDAGLTGKEWIAWLSDSETNAKDRIADTQYVRLDRAVVANNKTELLQIGPFDRLNSSIDIDQTGRQMPSTYQFPYVWTGTYRDGTKGVGSCRDWTVGNQIQGTDEGTGGIYSKQNSDWTYGVSKPCTMASWHHLYCFEYHAKPSVSTIPPTQPSPFESYPF